MRQRALAMLCCASLLWPWHAFAAAGSGDGGEHAVSTKEYFSTNAQRRMVIGVQVWGNVLLTGIHYVPDDTTITSLIGLAGGPVGTLDRATVTIRSSIQKGEPQSFPGKDLLASAKYDQVKLHDGDIVYVEVEPEKDTLGRNLSIISAVTGIITSFFAIYLFTHSKF